MCFMRRTIAYLCLNMIHCDAVVFSEHHFEEVIRFFWHSVYSHFPSSFIIPRGPPIAPPPPPRYVQINSYERFTIPTYLRFVLPPESPLIEPFCETDRWRLSCPSEQSIWSSRSGEPPIIDPLEVGRTSSSWIPYAGSNPKSTGQYGVVVSIKEALVDDMLCLSWHN